jgi:putative flippase GtrA
VDEYSLAVGGSRPDEPRPRRQFGRFATVGIANAAIDLGVFNLLDALNPTRKSLMLVAYNTVAVVAALTNSYWWNSLWTFKRTTPGRPRWSSRMRRLLFVIQGILNIGVNDAVVAGVAIALGSSAMLAPAVVANISKVAGMISASLVSFAAMRLIVFRHHPEPVGVGPGEAGPGADGTTACRAGTVPCQQGAEVT